MCTKTVKLLTSLATAPVLPYCEYECNENKLGYKATKMITDDTILRRVLAMTFYAFKIIRAQITTEKKTRGTIGLLE
jgi:hypothetical protein